MLWMMLSEEMTQQYRCMTFWYKFHYCTRLSFYSAQKLDGNQITMPQTLSDSQEHVDWVFGEMPLQRRNMKSKVHDINIFNILTIIYSARFFIFFSLIRLASTLR